MWRILAIATLHSWIARHHQGSREDTCGGPSCSLRQSFKPTTKAPGRIWPSTSCCHIHTDTAIVDIFNLLKASDSNEAHITPMPTSKTQYHSISGPTLPGRSGSVATFSVPPFHAPSRFGYGRPEAGPDLGARRTRDAVHGKRTMPPQSSESPAKKQSKWSAEEDALIIDLRGGGMKWEDISKRLPGRSAISCRLHYQNYLERRSEWDEERKNKLARLYER